MKAIVLAALACLLVGCGAPAEPTPTGPIQYEFTYQTGPGTMPTVATLCEYGAKALDALAETVDAAGNLERDDVRGWDTAQGRFVVAYATFSPLTAPAGGEKLRMATLRTIEAAMAVPRAWRDGEAGLVEAAAYATALDEATALQKRATSGCP